jgi:hypothetical protein
MHGTHKMLHCGYSVHCRKRLSFNMNRAAKARFVEIDEVAAINIKVTEKRLLHIIIQEADQNALLVGNSDNPC